MDDISNEITVAGICLRSSALFAGRTAFDMFKNDSIRDPVSYGLLGRRARQISVLLAELGVKAGDRVLLLSENRPEWPMAYFGIALAGAVSVPVLTGFSGEQVRTISEHAEVAACCLSRTFAAKMEPCPSTPLIFIDTIRDNDVTVSVSGAEKEIPLRDISAVSDQSFPLRKPDDLVSIVYTSGSLGNSKGVMLSNRNLVSCALATRKLVRIRPRDRLLSVLPLAHTYECTLGLLNVVISGAKISYLDRPPSPRALLSAARAVRPTAMITVPLLIEKIYRSHIAKALNASPLYRCALTKPLAARAAGRKLKRALGGSLRFFGIGGAPLSAEVERFLRKARFPYAPGYGLTEAAPVVTGTAPYCFPCHSAGSVLPGLDLRITPVNKNAHSLIGEIQVRGPNIMMGYYNDEEKTREAFTSDGWLRTGDIGCVNKKRKLYVRGRLKALILSPSGENIYPEEIEGLLSTSDLVEDALVFSGEKGELVAMIHISENAMLAARSAMNTLEKRLEELRVRANKKLAGFSRLSRIELHEEPFEKTPTLKIKRYLYVPSPS